MRFPGLFIDDEERLLARGEAAIHEIDEVLRLVLPDEYFGEDFSRQSPGAELVPIVPPSQELFDAIYSAFLARTRQLADDPAWEEALRRLVQPNSFEIRGDPPTVEFDPQVLADFHAATDAVLGFSLASDLALQVRGAVADVYASARQATATQLGETAGPLSLRDTRALDVLSRDSLFWVGDAYSSRISGAVNLAAANTLMQGFSPLETVELLKTSLGQEFQATDAYWYVVAEAAIGRAVNFGRVNQFRDFEVESYEFVAVRDERTSEICKFMDGRVFQVERAAQVVDSVLGAVTPDEVRTRQRWLNFDRGQAAIGRDALWFRDTPDGLPPDDPAQDSATRTYLPGSVFDFANGSWLPRGDAGSQVINVSLEQLGLILPPLHGRCRSDVVVSEEAVESFLQGPG